MLRVPFAPTIPGHSSVGFARPVKIETLSIQATYDRMVEGGVTHVAAADMILRYHGIDVEKSKWYKARSDNFQPVLAVGDSRDYEGYQNGASCDSGAKVQVEGPMLTNVGASLVDEIAVVDCVDDVVGTDAFSPVACDLASIAGQQSENPIGLSNFTHVVDTDSFDVGSEVASLMRASQGLDTLRCGQDECERDSPGYCYLLMFKLMHRESLALRFGPYPWLSELVALPQQVWDFQGLVDCKLDCRDRVAHLSPCETGGALDVLKERFSQLGFHGWGETFDNYPHVVVDKTKDLQLGGKVTIGSIGDLSDYDVLRGLMKREIIIPIVYASLHNYVRHQYRRELLDLQPVNMRMLTYGLDTYEYRGHSKRSLMVLMPGQFLCAGGVLVGSNSACVGVVVPPNSVMVALQRRGFSDQSDDMNVRVIRIPGSWDDTHLALPDTSTQARFASNEAGFYLHSGLRAAANIPALKFMESVSIDDPFDPHSAISDTRHTVSHDGSLSVRLPNDRGDPITVLSSFRVRQEQDPEFSICDVMHIYDDEASVAVNTAAIDVILTADRLMRGHVDDFSFHQKVLLDEYTYDGGGPSDDEGFPPAFGDYRGTDTVVHEPDGDGLHWLHLSDSEDDF